MRLSEQYFSVQGEGVTQGLPAYFIRLQGCNLSCGGQGAGWVCDTTSVWRRGSEISDLEIINKLESEGLMAGILAGKTHLVWTGGEPVIQRREICTFLNELDSRYGENQVYNEVETNGTIDAPTGFWDRIQQINCSPKLSNSGMLPKNRIVPEAIKEIKGHYNPWFKFVITREEDLKEAERDFIHPFGLDKDRVILMPAGMTETQCRTNLKTCYDLTKKYGYRTIGRGHIEAYGRTTGV